MLTPLSFDPFSSINTLRVGTPYPLLSGSLPAQAGEIIEFIINDHRYSTPIAADGSWSFQPPFSLSEGSHDMVACIGDSGEPHPFSVDVALSVSDKPAITALFDDVGSETGPVGRGHTIDDTTPKVQGYALPGSTVRLYDHDRLIGSTVASKSGEWSLEPLLGAGGHQLTVTATDEFGRVSEPSDHFDITVVESGPVPPTISYAIDDVGTVQGQLASGSTTDDFSPLIVGRAEPNSIVYLFAQNDHGGIGYKGSVKTDANGDWVIQSRAMISGDGIYTFYASYANSKDDYRPDFSLNMSALENLRPAIDCARDDTGAHTGQVYHRGTTDDKTPVLEGRGAPGSIVEIEYNLSNSGWHSAGSVTVDAQGNWQFAGFELTYFGEWGFRSRGVADGKASAWSDKFELLVIPGAPLEPTIDYAWDNAGPLQGPVYQHDSTDDTTPTLHGSGTPGQVIEIEYGVQGEGLRHAGSVQVDADGKWSFTSPYLHQPGVWEYQARASTGEMKSNWSSKFVLDVSPDAAFAQQAQDEAQPDALTLHQLLSEGGKGLFIEDDSTQLLVNGKPGDSVQLQDILPAGEAADGWTQQTGTLTIAGTQYHVWSHGDAELLVQDGVQLQLV